MNPRRWPRLVVMGLVRAYQVTLAPYMFTQCRFNPTCSRDTYEAVERYGALKGSWLALKRILRCNPWGGCGHDPVP